MTASSVELFPCRVQLMGLPRSTTSATSAASGSANLENLSIGISRQTPIQKVKRVSRNLFGSPDPVEMKNLYQKEAERQRKYVLGRYNFDTKSSSDANQEYNKKDNATDKHDSINGITVSSSQPTAFPTLIQQELKKHDGRLRCKKSLRRNSVEETPSNAKISNHISEVRRRCDYMTTLSPAVDQQKPYTRQSLLTERFNIRKSKVCLSRNPKSLTIDEVTANSPDETRNIELPQLLDKTDCNITHEEDTKSLSKKTCGERDRDSKSDLVCKDKHTTVSLQFLVSTQNLS